jgi:hypothetical protein
VPEDNKTCCGYKVLSVLINGQEIGKRIHNMAITVLYLTSHESSRPSPYSMSVRSILTSHFWLVYLSQPSD